MEAKFKIIKTEFISQMKFDSLELLTLEFSHYINWFNKVRIRGTLGYAGQIEYKKISLKKLTIDIFKSKGLSFCQNNSPKRS
jgi:putative transposase